MRFVLFMRGATAWEGQVGPLWWHVRYPRFWRTSGLGFVRLVESEDAR